MFFLVVHRSLLAETCLAQVDEVEVMVVGKQLVIRPVQYVRAGWAEQFRAMAASGDDRMLDADAGGLTAWEDTEWRWTE